MSPDYKAIIEGAGGKFIYMQENTVFFWNEDETRVLSLYIWAVDHATVALTLKDCRERVLDFPPLLKTEV
jgi:hypothetical protein